MVKMRRVPAILLVFLFSFPLIAPALYVDGQSNLPACCRRHGQHHCGMLDGAMADLPGTPTPVPAADALRSRCPLFPNGGAVLPHAGAALPVASQPANVFTAIQAAAQAQAAAGYRLSFNRAHNKRGPPSLLS